MGSSRRKTSILAFSAWSPRAHSSSLAALSLSLPSSALSESVTALAATARILRRWWLSSSAAAAPPPSKTAAWSCCFRAAAADDDDGPIGSASKMTRRLCPSWEWRTEDSAVPCRPRAAAPLRLYWGRRRDSGTVREGQNGHFGTKSSKAKHAENRISSMKDTWPSSFLLLALLVMNFLLSLLLVEEKKRKENSIPICRY